MASIGQHYKKVKANLSEKKVEIDLFTFIKSIEDVIVAYNVSQINDDSKDIYGKPIGFYSKATEIITGGEKREGQPFTGYDTGSWLGSFFLRSVNGGLQIWAKDTKTVDIFKSKAWLSHDLFGLSDQHLQEVIDLYIKPYLLKQARNVL